VLVGKLIGVSVLGGLGLLAWLTSPSFLLLMLAIGMGLLGWFAPDIVLTGRAKERQQKLGEELPEVLDQMTVSVEAGLGFEAALARVVEEGGSVLSEEFGRSLQDIRLGVSRERALMRLLERNDSPDLKHFVLMLGQADRLGVPMANVLRVLADEMRERRRVTAQEKAMKIPAKLVFPLVLCVLPALFVAILGPALMRLFNDGLF
jgi:tight adherence protein C